MAVALLALFVALGGTASALVITGRSIKDNSVSGIDIRDGGLRGKDVRDRSLVGRDLAGRSLTTREVRDRSLLAGDFRPGELPVGSRGPQGETGPAGPKGETGPPGPQRAPGIGRVEARGSSAVNSESPKTATANCPPGTVVIGTGFLLQGVGPGTFDELAIGVARIVDDTRVIVSGHEVAPASFNWFVTAQAICALVAP